MILFFPPIVRVVLAAHAHSLLFRVVLTIPYAATLAYCTLGALERLRAPRPANVALAGATLAIVLMGLTSQFASIRASWAIPEGRRAEYKENEALMRALDFIDRRFPTVQTILSDPLSSYSIPAYTKHDAVAPLNQHSSPTDPSVDDRIRDVQDALNGRVGLQRTFRVIRRYGAGLILVNQSFARLTSSYYYFVTPLAYQEQRAKFDRRAGSLREDLR